ncbi:MAG: N-acetylmuramoyl-L-alanine amidase [Candidatus Tectomicrobia bacterium]|nr:N-acetylmuramoyl-L-alanine amidase [Candidatus Tectomicrobia bacterium]
MMKCQHFLVTGGVILLLLLLQSPLLAGEVVPLRTVVIDPGHGGEDIGSAGINELKEKEITLAAAKVLKKLIEKQFGARVVLTRNRDEDLPVRNRPSIANYQKADLFVSLHVGGGFDSETRGGKVYFYSSGEEEKEEAERRSASSPTKTRQALPLWEKGQLEHQRESRLLARSIFKALNEVSPSQFSDAMGAPLAVLQGATMPAVLIELGTLSYPEDEVQLRNPESLKMVTQAIFQGIQEYWESLRRQRGPEPQGRGDRPVAPTPEKEGRGQISLYFSPKGGRFLTVERRNIELDKSKLESEQVKAVLEELSKGPSKDGVRTLPAQAPLRNVYIDKEKWVYLDFGKELQETHPSGAWTEILTIYSIVHTIMQNFPQMKGVYFLLNGEERETLAGHIDLTAPFSKWESLVK